MAFEHGVKKRTNCGTGAPQRASRTWTGRDDQLGNATSAATLGVAVSGAHTLSLSNLILVYASPPPPLPNHTESAADLCQPTDGRPCKATSRASTLVAESKTENWQSSAPVTMLQKQLVQVIDNYRVRSVMKMPAALTNFPISICHTIFMLPRHCSEIS